MAKRTGRRQSPLERKATQHTEFVGGAADKQAESKQQEHDRGNEDVVREMASELEEMAGVKQDGSPGPEVPFRLPRSVDEGKRLIREAPEALREKARERLSTLPEPAQQALHVAEAAVQVMLVPVRIGAALARELFRLPREMFRVFREV